MSQKGTINRIFLIIEKIRNHQIPTIENIIDYLHAQGHEVTKRTVQRDVEQILNYGIKITYNRKIPGYEIEESIDNIDNFLYFLEIINNTELFINCIKDSPNVIKYLSFDMDNARKEPVILKQLLFAIQNTREVSFLHKNSRALDVKKYIFSPYYLKEFMKRWYIIGKSTSENNFISFAVDRIEDLLVTDVKFNKTYADKDDSEMFSDMVGVIGNDGELAEIMLSFTPVQGKYIKLFPLHKSQKIVKETDEELLVQYFIVPTTEFTQFLLMHGDKVKIIKPLWLIEEIKQIYQNCLNAYL